jgi:hypothetical protein
MTVAPLLVPAAHMSAGESAVTWSNLALVAVTILATGVTLWLTLKDSRKHEDKAVDRVQDAAELSEERLAAIAMAAIDKYEHSSHSADPTDVPTQTIINAAAPPADKDPA